mmetsp:Transcript_8215/g.21767  ORF Transcript_8215/g.21767 Transcript_8215/m.21767 type:complete len:280 (-) Transcript_8215:147-986(-)
MRRRRFARGNEDACESGRVEHGVDEAAVDNRRVLLQHALVQPAVHSLARPAGAERPSTSHEHVEHRHADGSLDVAPSGASEREHDIRTHAHGVRFNFTADVRASVRGCGVTSRQRAERGLEQARHFARGRTGGCERDALSAHVGLVELRDNFRVLGEHVELVPGRDERLVESSSEGGHVRALDDLLVRVLVEVVKLELHLLHLRGDFPRQECGVHDGISEHLDDFRRESAQRVGVKDELFSRGCRRHADADRLHLAHEPEVRAVRGGLERELFEEVARS